MPDPVTTVLLGAVTLALLTAALAATARLLGSGSAQALARLEVGLLSLCTVVLTGLFAYRIVVVHQAAPPLRSHVDGLLLIAALGGMAILFLDRRPRLPGVRAFGLPLLTFLTAWAVCASAWTYVPFDFRVATMGQVWRSVHLLGVYGGTLFVALAAMAGAMYLTADRRLRRKQPPMRSGPLASLEAIERVIVHGSALGFALLTLGLISGVVVLIEEPMGWSPGPWFTVKIALSLTAWLIYALLMNVRHAALFRGSRAAWLSICGLGLLVATFSIVTALPTDAAGATPAAPPSLVEPSQPAVAGEGG
jgi:ABC-type uncharacterized transport system permease subunit